MCLSFCTNILNSKKSPSDKIHFLEKTGDEIRLCNGIACLFVLRLTKRCFEYQILPFFAGMMIIFSKFVDYFAWVVNCLPGRNP